ncbi:hypothetical protein BDN70DRAFT_989891 [Pholiota conissans]|uniref:Transmembrane protein n=1 Tax=Pholiota conissans TaxID=109636 RepID=A0A9P5ZDU4_9AGAR|nr:hypothetical protein BDN70DRAFT_989891 [Pholiota conissans]
MSDTTLPSPPPPQSLPSSSSSHQAASPPEERREPLQEGIQPSVVLKIRHTISTTSYYANWAIEEVLKPSVQTFIETCDTNPRIAAVVATPALLAFSLVAALFVLTASAVVLYSILTISVGIILVVIGGLISLAFKLIVVFLATIPLAGMAAGLLVGANSVSKFIINKLPDGSTDTVTKTFKEIDWKALVDGTSAAGGYAVRGVKEFNSVMIVVGEALYTLAMAAHSALETAMAALHDQQQAAAPELESRTITEEPMITEVEVEGVVTTAVVGSREAGAEAVAAEQPAPVLIESQESPEKLKRRTPYPYLADQTEPYA